MFNIGVSELLVILLIAFLVVGPKDLPKVARAIARSIRYLKTKWAEFLEESELDDTLKDFRTAGEDIKKAVREVSPVEEIKQAREEVRAAVAPGERQAAPDEKAKEETK
ncbi:MAG: twin-arginine translocase TatA/TatE family subunit [Christensenellales bacterium]|jgi:sec-independent protein translocase protein TatB